jgi:hypothetical protein
VTAVIAILLLTAALAKTYQLATELISWDAFTRAEYLLVAIIVVELALASLILSGRHVRLTRILALATFLAFAAYSLYLALRDEPSCGCFGRVPVSPWVTFVLDLAIVGTLLISRTPATARSNAGRILRPYLAGAAGLCLASGMGLYLWFGSVPVGLAYLAGERVIVHPNVLRLGSGTPGQKRDVNVAIRNLHSQPVRVLGVKQLCNGYIADTLPLELGPGEQRIMPLVLLLANAHNGSFRLPILLYTNCATQPVILLEVTGRIN